MKSEGELETVKAKYWKIQKAACYYGKYHKTIFHLHTPASHDYNLLSKWVKVNDNDEGYEQKTAEDVLKQIHIANNVLYEQIRTILSEDKEFFPSEYSNQKEWFAYTLLADALYKSKIETVLVTDHNTVAGVLKLRESVQSLSKQFTDYQPCINVMSGVEISCADKTHVVVGFEDEVITKVDNWLKENLINEKDGSFQTSLSVFNEFNNEGSYFVYIAHINTANVFNEKSLSGAYKQKLLNDKNLQIIGVKEQDEIDNVINRAEKYSSIKHCFVYDCDSHEIETVSRLPMWIKYGHYSFRSIREALHDFETSVCLETANSPSTYIDGLLITNYDDGFLTGKEKEDFCVKFSNSLNCFIGGRGTGKSTVLDMMNLALSQIVDSEKQLEFMSKHGNIWLLCKIDKEEYVFNFCMPVPDNGESVLSCFVPASERTPGKKYQFHREKIEEVAQINYLEIYKIYRLKDNQLQVYEINNKRKKADIQRRIFNKRYSMNSLVTTAINNDLHEMNNFIFETIAVNEVYVPFAIRGNFRKETFLNRFNEFYKNVSDRENRLANRISEFNNQQKDTINIYNIIDEDTNPPFFRWLFGTDAYKIGHFDKYNITREDVSEYLQTICYKIGFLKLLQLANKSNENERHSYDVGKLLDKVITYDDDEIDNNGKKALVDKIFDCLISKRNYETIATYVNDLMEKRINSQYYLNLKFNINHNEESRRLKNNFKEIQELSLGQKVVAILNLIICYGDSVNDYRPLIIDQPEDNLDSRYIYNNLVPMFIKTKKSRQIIIATHNSTIVTNSMSDLVCVMKSDGIHGWIEKMGYPSEDRIKQEIVDCLEGGIESFVHKEWLYQSVIEKRKIK